MVSEGAARTEARRRSAKEVRVGPVGIEPTTHGLKVR
jgi:hypothetical protein